jgi:hypothetical protein
VALRSGNEDDFGRMVTIGVVSDRGVEVLSGLARGDLIVGAGVDRLIAGPDWSSRSRLPAASPDAPSTGPATAAPARTDQGMNALIAFAVHRWQVTLVVFALVAALGAQAFLSIPRSVDPHFKAPVASVIAILPGADPADIEQTVAKPIEDALSSLDNIRELQSSSSDGQAVITAEFTWESDPDRNFDEAVREVNAIGPICRRASSASSSGASARPRRWSCNMPSFPKPHPGGGWKRWGRI